MKAIRGKLKMRHEPVTNWLTRLSADRPPHAPNVLRALLVLSFLFPLAACANGAINTRVDQSILFRPSLVHYGTGGKELPLLIYGAPLPQPLTGDKLAQAIAMPAQYHPIRLRYIANPDPEFDAVRLVLLVNPSRIPQPETMCSKPGKAQSVAAQPSALFVVLCAGSRYVAKGMVTSAAGGTSDVNVLGNMLHGLLSDMLRQPRRSPNGPLFATLIQPRA
ncbi:MAG TPA: hypothetical protein DCF61_02165 [Alphaproteobacteria bacterium]|nr:hypothetical protein [Alphaproteobacteria bacterium]HCO89865.1 hypothetical protein [Alphaproteobacteria bacterium]